MAFLSCWKCSLDFTRSDGNEEQGIRWTFRSFLDRDVEVFPLGRTASLWRHRKELQGPNVSRPLQ